MARPAGTYSFAAHLVVTGRPLRGAQALSGMPERFDLLGDANRAGGLQPRPALHALFLSWCDVAEQLTAALVCAWAWRGTGRMAVNTCQTWAQLPPASLTCSIVS